MNPAVMSAKSVFDAIKAELKRRGIDPREAARSGVSPTIPSSASADPIANYDKLGCNADGAKSAAQIMLA